MGVCISCNSELPDEQLTDGICPNCAAGSTEAPAATEPAEEVVATEEVATPEEAPVVEPTAEQAK